MCVVACVLVLQHAHAATRDLPEVIESGVLRHIGVPYANFVTGSGDGLDVELMQGFAAHLGVRYQYVTSTWPRMIGDLTGHHARRGDAGVEILNSAPIRGDVIANGMTVLAWRSQVVDFSAPTFPSAVWLVARADATISPIRPTGSVTEDIQSVRDALRGISVLTKENTCLDPGLYDLSETGAEVRLAGSGIEGDEMAPAILHDAAESTLLDVPGALIALEIWPGALKVVGPVSENQTMAAAFRKDSPKLRAAFNVYLAQIRADGTYSRLVRKYFPAVFLYFAEFFPDRS
ncbi:MAG: transporter substrate-binding domain-containing protein [Gammaproteobacteria bacterium]|nr:transporter substrate-binding domain-containing protein [Gammaproteobacteria bacterium]